MKEMWNVAKYRLQCYFSGYTFAMPFIIVCVILRFMYSIKPQDVVSSYLISVQFIFIIMVWIGMMETNRENRVMEQVLELRVKNKWAYFAGKMLFLFILSMLMTVICTVWPIVQNNIENGTFFERAYLPEDFLNSFILLLGSSYCGAALGSFLHPDICKDRKVAIALTVLFALLAILRDMISVSQPVLKYVLWIIPNVAHAATQYGNEQFFNISTTLQYFCVLMIYAVVYGVVGSFWQCRKRA